MFCSTYYSSRLSHERQAHIRSFSIIQLQKTIFYQKRERKEVGTEMFNSEK